MHDFEAATAAAGLAWLALTGMVYAVLFVADRRRPGHGWLSAQMLGAAVFSLLACGGTRGVVGGEPHLLVVTGALALACVASVFVTHAHFRLERTPRVWLVLLLVVETVCIASAAVPVGEFPVVFATATLVSLVVGYQLYVLIRLIRTGEPVLNAATMLAGWTAVAVTAAVDAAGLVDSTRFITYGLSVFAFVQTVALARQHLTSVEQAERLREELAARVLVLEETLRKNDFLNDELRRRLGAHSARLAGELARLSSSSGADDGLWPGDVVAGRYRVVQCIGAGGMGRVYEVERDVDGARFALKVVGRTDDLVHSARLAREAQMLSELDHPGLVSIVDVGVSECGRLYLVMELVDGRSLDELRPVFGNLEWALPIAGRIAAALDAVHGAGIVHRDLKPANILVDGAQVKLADFGLSERGVEVSGAITQSLHPAMASTAAMDPLTRTGTIMGTPMYMDPSLASGKGDYPASADVFSFGLVVYELVTGSSAFSEPPFASRMLGKPIAAHVPFGEARPDLDQDLARVLDGCLSLDPAQRPSSHALARVLAAACDASLPLLPAVDAAPLGVRLDCSTTQH